MFKEVKSSSVVILTILASRNQVVCALFAYMRVGHLARSHQNKYGVHIRISPIRVTVTTLGTLLLQTDHTKQFQSIICSLDYLFTVQIGKKTSQKDNCSSNILCHRQSETVQHFSTVQLYQVCMYYLTFFIDNKYCPTVAIFICTSSEEQAFFIDKTNNVLQLPSLYARPMRNKYMHASQATIIAHSTAHNAQTSTTNHWKILTNPRNEVEQMFSIHGNECRQLGIASDMQCRLKQYLSHLTIITSFGLI